MNLKQQLIIVIFILFLSCSTIFPTHTQATGAGYWHTSGNKILDSNNQSVRIAGVNWFGLEGGSFAPHGLWTRGYREMMDQMKQLGFNTIRLPYSNDILNTANKPSGGIDYGKNPDLQGLSGLQIMDKVVEYANVIGMRVVLDRHRPDQYGQSSLWYTASVPESKWIDDWKTLARRYKGNTAVVAFDLHNEPNGVACWGCADLSKDWKSAAERAGNAVLTENPNLLIIVEGIQRYGNHWYWWGGELEGVKSAQVKLNVSERVVYSTHDYPQSVWNQSWFNEPGYPANLPALWDSIWGYIHKTNLAPVLIGEFGTKLETLNDKLWYDAITAYIKTNNLSWVYWSWNPNSGDTGGILTDDWKTVNVAKYTKLQPLQFALDSVISIAVPSPTQTPTSTPLPKPTTPVTVIVTPIVACKVSYSVIQSWNNNGFNVNVSIQNTSAQAINGWKLVWQFAGNQKVQNLWNGNVNQSGSIVTVRSLDWNKVIGPGSSTSFGFVGSYSGANQNPSVFKVNDVQCM